jgi:hypothetical protein
MPSSGDTVQLYVNAEIPPPDGIATLDVHIDGFSESWFVDEAEMNADNATAEGEALSADNGSISRDRSASFSTRSNITLGLKWRGNRRIT